MLNSQLHNYTNQQLSRYTNRQLSLLNTLGYVYDRTYQDVERWRELRDKGWDNMTEVERQEWLGEIVPTPAASKGMYTHNDLNRVEKAVDDIAFYLRDMGYAVPNMTLKLDWTYQDVVTKSDMDRYFSNIETLRNIVGVPPTTPKTPTTNEKFDFRKANDVEKILDDILVTMNKLTESWYYSGELRLGEV